MYSLYLVFLLFSIINGQVTWVGKGANSLWTDPANWMNGIPSSDSDVFINCENCTIILNTTVTVSKLNINTMPMSGDILGLVNLQIQAGSLTISNVLTVGLADIVISQGGSLVVDTNCEAFFYTRESFVISASDSGLLVNKGKINAMANGTYNQVQIGYYPDSELTVDNWGSWIANEAQFYFYGVIFNQYGGEFQSTWNREGQQTIIFYESDVYFESGSESTNFNGPISFASYILNGNNVVINTTGLTLPYGTFNGVNVLFNYNGTLENFNVTGFGLITSTTQTTVTVSGEYNYFERSGILCDSVDGATLTVLIQANAIVYISEYFFINGSVVLINNGTWTNPQNSKLNPVYWYFNSESTFLNLGLFQALAPNNLYGTEQLKTIGTFINRGTLQFIEGGSLIFSNGSSGNFYQCSDAVMKFGMVPTGDVKLGVPFFANIRLDGYLTIELLDTFYILSQELFRWNPQHYNFGMWRGDLKLYLSQKGVVQSIPNCYDSYKGISYIFSQNSDQQSQTCQTLSFIENSDSWPNGENACSKVQQEFMDLTPRCTYLNNCGLNTNPPNSASIPTISLFLLSLIWLNIFF